MRILLALAFALVAIGGLPVTTADPPVNWNSDGNHFGIWVDGTTTNNQPTDVTVNRNDLTNNVLHWLAPANTDGRDLVGFVVYRIPGGAAYAPVDYHYISGATSTSYRDTVGDFNGVNVYFVTAVFSDKFGVVRTESMPTLPVVVNGAVGPGGYPYCETIQINLAVFPYVFVQPLCIFPPPGT